MCQKYYKRQFVILQRVVVPSWHKPGDLVMVLPHDDDDDDGDDIPSALQHWL